MSNAGHGSLRSHPANITTPRSRIAGDRIEAGCCTITTLPARRRRRKCPRDSCNSRTARSCGYAARFETRHALEEADISREEARSDVANEATLSAAHARQAALCRDFRSSIRQLCFNWTEFSRLRDVRQLCPWTNLSAQSKFRAWMSTTPPSVPGNSTREPQMLSTRSRWLWDGTTSLANAI